MREGQTRDERALTELFHRLPPDPTPLGFRDAVMGRIAATRARTWRWEWLLAAVTALPNLLFLAWSLADGGDDMVGAFGGLASALLGLEDWDPGTSVYVDGLLLVAVALIGLAALIATHALIGESRARSRTLAA